MWFWGKLKGFSVEDRPKELLKLAEEEAVPLIIQFGDDTFDHAHELFQLLSVAMDDKYPANPSPDQMAIEFSCLATKLSGILSRQGISLKSGRLMAGLWSELASAWCIVDSDDEANQILEFLIQNLPNSHSDKLFWESAIDTIRRDNPRSSLGRLEQGYIQVAFCKDGSFDSELKAKLLNVLSIGWTKKLTHERLCWLMSQSAKLSEDQCCKEIDPIRVKFLAHQLSMHACGLLNQSPFGCSWRLNRIEISTKYIYLVGVYPDSETVENLTCDKIVDTSVLEPLRSQAEMLGFGLNLSVQLSPETNLLEFVGSFFR